MSTLLSALRHSRCCDWCFSLVNTFDYVAFKEIAEVRAGYMSVILNLQDLNKWFSRLALLTLRPNKNMRYTMWNHNKNRQPWKTRKNIERIRCHIWCYLPIQNITVSNAQTSARSAFTGCVASIAHSASQAARFATIIAPSKYFPLEYFWADSPDRTAISSA